MFFNLTILAEFFEAQDGIFESKTETKETIENQETEVLEISEVDIINNKNVA